jgi:nucleotide-binding universal stress UspA family protein
MEFLGSLPLAAGSELLIVSVVPQQAALESARDLEEPVSTPPAERSLAQDTVDQAAYYLAKPGVSTESLVRSGHPADVICRMAEERRVALVVVGSRGRSALERFLLRSVSNRVAKHAPCSALVVKPPPRFIQKVLLCVDGSENSQQAVSYLKQFPLPPECSVIAVHVVHLPPPTFSGARGYYETAELSGELEKLRHAAEAEGKGILDGIATTLGKSRKVESMLTSGPPARRLVELAGELSVDLVVVGSRGLTSAERFLMGSVSLQVCQHAPCSVLVVR